MYVDLKFYSDEYKGESIDPMDFSMLENRAAEIVEEMTMYRLNESVLSNMSPNMQKCVKKAVCAQIEYMDINGGVEFDTGSSISSGSIGKFSFTKGGNSADAQSIYAPRAQRLLYPTGLLYRGRL